jgi:hypothetical protein
MRIIGLKDFFYINNIGKWRFVSHPYPTYHQQGYVIINYNIHSSSVDIFSQ